MPYPAKGHARFLTTHYKPEKNLSAAYWYACPIHRAGFKLCIFSCFLGLRKMNICSTPARPPHSMNLSASSMGNSRPSTLTRQSPRFCLYAFSAAFLSVVVSSTVSFPDLRMNTSYVISVFFLARHTALPPQSLCAADTNSAFLRTHLSASRVYIRPSPCTAPCRIGCPYYLYRRDTPGSSLGYGAFGSLSLLAWPTPPFPLLPPGSSFAPPPASFPLFQMRRNPPPSLCTPAFC